MTQHTIGLDIKQVNIGATADIQSLRRFVEGDPDSSQIICDRLPKDKQIGWEIASFFITGIGKMGEETVASVNVIVEDSPKVKHTVQIEFDILSYNDDDYLFDWFRNWFNSYDGDAYLCLFELYTEEEPHSLELSHDWLEIKYDTDVNTDNIVWDNIQSFLRGLQKEGNLYSDMGISINKNTVYALFTLEWEQAIPK